MTDRTPRFPRLELDHDHRRHVVGGEPLVLHCHHYNTFLQRTIQDAAYIDSEPFLVGAATEVAHHQVTEALAGIDDLPGRLAAAQTLYSWAGFGIVDLSDLEPGGGIVEAPVSHYASAWQITFGTPDRAVDLFTRGWLAGAVAAVFGAERDAYTVTQQACIATGAEVGRFAVDRQPAPHPVRRSVGVGPLSERPPAAYASDHLDAEGIYWALVEMPLEGDETGLIPAFGVHLTRHYANYCNRISFEFERAMVDRFGDAGLEAARPLLVEAGHVCAFNTFGGIMESAEWEALVRPALRTPEDWVRAMVTAVDALGWGRWQVTDVDATSATFVLHDDYESVGHLAMYGPSDHPVSYLAEGALLGIMNLIYRGRIAERPALTPAFYDEMFRSTGSYTAVCKTSRAMGDEATIFVVNAPA